MPSKYVAEDVAKAAGKVLIESGYPDKKELTNQEILDRKLASSQGIITLVRELIRDKKITKNESGEIELANDARIKKPKVKVSYKAGSDQTPATDKVEAETVKHILEEQTRHTKDVAIEVLTEALGLGRFARDNFQTKARFGEFKNIQAYLFECSHFWEVYHELVPQMDEQISMMGEAMRNMEYRMNELLGENQQKEYLIREFKAMVERRD